MSKIAISTGPCERLDHIGVFAAQHSIPLIVTREEAYIAAKKFYPQLATEYKDIGELTPDFLSQYSLIVGTDRPWAWELSCILETLFQKKPRFVYCPHGNSDKGYSATDSLPQDIVLLYGNHMYDLLKKTGELERIHAYHFIGNFRYDFYLKNQKFYDEIVDKEIFFNYPKKRKRVLYAPTWHTLETPSSFFDSCAQLVEELPPSYQMIIKLHPCLKECHPSQTYRLMGRFESHPDVLFLEDFPPIYPLLAQTDIYIGDFSSVGYDFLTFNRPMYFFNPHAHEPSRQSRFLHQCGLTLPATNIFSFIEATLDQNQKELFCIRQSTYQYTFETSGASPFP